MASRLHVSVPETLVARPIVYELVTDFGVVPNIRRAAVESNEGWMILELGGEAEAVERAVAHLVALGCTVNPMDGDIVAG